MVRSPRAVSVAILGGAIATLAVTACDPLAPISALPADSPSPAASDSATPTSEPESDVLFTITVSTTDSTNVPVRLVMIAHAPQAWNAPGRDSIKNTFATECTSDGGAVDDSALSDEGATLMVIDITSSPAGHTLSGSVGVQIGSPYYYQIATGDGFSNPDDRPCSSGYQLDSTGTISAISSFGTGSPSPDLLQWRTGRYGFSTEPPTILSDCTIHVTSLAVAAHVSDVDGWSIDRGSETDCAIGYQGE